ncbi:MAG: LuxR C-terminal-related transcriptional regulator [Verrucomicrobiota bacterium]
MTELELRDEDIRAMIRLLGEVGAAPLSLESKRVFMMEGVAALIGAEKWTWSILGTPSVEQELVNTVLIHGGFSEEQLAEHLKLQEHEDLQWLTAPLMKALGQATGQTTRLQQQLANEEQIAQASIYPLFQKAGLGAAMFSCRPTSNGQISAISLFRNLDDGLFSRREARIAHILLSEVPWLHDIVWTSHLSDSVSSLSKRQRIALSFMIQGKSRKQIASDMEISVHTVNDHVKELYRIFAVQSHVELMRRFIEGDGGDLERPVSF